VVAAHSIALQESKDDEWQADTTYGPETETRQILHKHYEKLETVNHYLTAKVSSESREIMSPNQMSMLEMPVHMDVLLAVCM